MSVRLCLLFVGLLALLQPTAAWGQSYPELTGQYFFGLAGRDEPTAMIAGPDSTLYLAGTVEGAEGCRDGWLLRVTWDGEVLWSRRMYGGGCTLIHGLALGREGGVFLAGARGVAPPLADVGRSDRRLDYYIAKYSKEGDLFWEKTYGGPMDDQAYALAPTDFGGVVVVGTSWSRSGDVPDNAPPKNNLWMLILGKTGEIIRSKVFGGNGNDVGMSVARTPTNTYFITGYTTSADLDASTARHNGDAWVLLTDFAGNMQWQKVLKAPYEDVLHQGCVNDYGLLAAVGSTFKPGRSKDFWFVKMNDQGKVLHNLSYGEPDFDELRGITPLSQGGYLATGYYRRLAPTHPLFKGKEDLFVQRLSSTGRVEWETTFGGPDDEQGIAVAQASSNLFFVLGSKQNTFMPEAPNRGQDFWLVRIAEIRCGELNPRFRTDLVSNTGQVGKPIRFFNLTEKGVKFRWDFGDGTRSDQRNPVKTYDEPGNYQVNLTVTVTPSCSATYYSPSRITIAP